MARRPQTSIPAPAPRLLVPHNTARDNLISRREAGKALLAGFQSTINSKAALGDAQPAYQKWRDFNSELLRRMFDQPEYAEAFDRIGHIGIYVLGAPSYWADDAQEFYDKVQGRIDYLDNLAERIELIPLAPGVETPAIVQPAGRFKAARGERTSSKVFIVHGRDEEAKAVVARFVERCGLIPVILHEQTDQGRTIIEKFEQESDVGFAVVLLTPDDVGGINETSPDTVVLRPRARQNVILELGYFVGTLGRDRVCAFLKGDIEVPSDFSGVLYTPFGSDESWKMRLARELKAASFDIDLNVALG